MTKPIQLDVNYTDRQWQAALQLDRPDIRRLMYGGAKGGAKSHFLCIWSFLQAWDIASKFGLLPGVNPLHVGWIGRKQATDFTATTLQTWRRIIPEQYYQIKSGTEKDPKHILIMDRIAIDFGGLDKQENINKFNSAEYAFFAIDQAEETERDEVSVIQGSLRLTINGHALNYKELYTANPANCWLKSEFITNPKPENVFIPALPGDNPYLPNDYVKTLQSAFGHRPELLNAYLYGSWDSLDGATQVIKSAWIEATKKRYVSDTFIKHYLVCDTARFGDDETVIGRFQDCNLVEKLAFGFTKSTEISARLAMESEKHKNIPIVVEAVGSDIGAAVVDELSAMNRNVIVYCPQGQSQIIDPNTGKPKFYNVRAEAWWTAAEYLCNGIAETDGTRVTVACPKLDAEIQGQLLQPTYEFRNGKLLIEDKAKIKKRLGRSPDHADMFVIGLWAFDKVPAMSEIQQRETEFVNDYSYDPMDLVRL